MSNLTTSYKPASSISDGFAIGLSLEFFVQPSNVETNTSISPALVVRVVDGAGEVYEDFSGNITISINTNPGGGSLSGTVTRAAADGVATFNDLKISLPGNGYKLQAANSLLETVVSDAFNVSALNFTLTAVDLSGGGADIFGYSDGDAPPGPPIGGGISPATYLGFNVGAVVVENLTDPPGSQILGFIVRGNIPQNSFTTFKINGDTFTSASASYSDGPGFSEWQWDSITGPINSAGSYPIQIA